MTMVMIGEVFKLTYGFLRVDHHHNQSVSRRDVNGLLSAITSITIFSSLALLCLRWFKLLNLADCRLSWFETEMTVAMFYGTVPFEWFWAEYFWWFRNEMVHTSRRNNSSWNDRPYLFTAITVSGKTNWLLWLIEKVLLRVTLFFYVMSHNLCV